MIDSGIRTIEYPNGEIQRVQLVCFDSLAKLDFLRPEYDRRAFDRVADLYEQFIVPSKPYVFGQLVLFHLPQDIDICFRNKTKAFGTVADSTVAAAIALRRGVRIIGGKPVFLNGKAKKLWQELEKHSYIRIIRGKLPVTTIIPVGDGFGFLSENEINAELKVNSSFFIMDRFDCMTPYDMLGKPVGLMVKDGTVLNPPMFLRESLLCRRDGSVSIEITDLRKLKIEINGKEYRHGENAAVYLRPETRKTPHHDGTDVVVSGGKVVAVKEGGGTFVPSSGFVMSIGVENYVNLNDVVEYRGLEDVSFGIQVGNSIIVEGRKTEKFISPFYNIYKLWSTSFPPSLYPLDFEKARAPRIALGTDRKGRGMLAWIEGPGKFSEDFSKESCGASLKETADICEMLGMFNAVNLDGGGSAQILLNNSRALKVSDRNAGDFSEAERAVPAGLLIR